MAKKKSVPAPEAIGPAGKSDEDWKAEEDARTMERMGEIMADPKRHARAKKAAKEKMDQMMRSHAMMSKMTGGGKMGEDESMGGMIKKRQKERTL